MSDWKPEVAMLEVGQGVYDGYIWAAVNKLFSKLPYPKPDKADMYQEFVLYALEAVRRYRPEKSTAKFSTVLVTHLQMRSLQWFNWANMPMNKPKDRWVYSFSMLENEESKSIDLNFADPCQLFVSQLQEFRGLLSERNQQLFNYFTDYLVWEEQNGRSAFHDALGRLDIKLICVLTTLSEDEVRNFIREVLEIGRASVEV